MRRLWVWCLLIGVSVTAISASSRAAELPVGSNPPAVVFSHFPDRLHAVVFRNWNLVSPQRIALAVGATEKQIVELAAAMGLPPARPIDPHYQRQIYITIVRHNWHLLPYDQLLTLLDMTADELAFGLREDDFLYIKLGSLKPKCEPVRYVEPDVATRAAEAQIKRWVTESFGEALNAPGEPRFAFVDELSKLPAGEFTGHVKPDEGPRYIYSYFGVFGDPLLNAELDPYPEGLLRRLADHGVNGVWLHVVLRQLAPGSEAFPEFGADHEKRLANLNRIVQRAKKYGISVYLYMNEPRAQPIEFFDQPGRVDMAGVREGDHIAMCTSNPVVRKWLTDSLAYVFEHVPGLGGVFTITASENLTNCASHGRWKQCPRCKDRTDAQIIAEVNAAMEAGVHRGSPTAKVIAWDWGWRGHGDGREIIAKLPDDVWLMSVSEWAKPIERGGVASKVGEYSLSAVGPGPRAQSEWAAAEGRGLKTVAKVQLNATWELAAMPYLPVMDLVAEHCENLAKEQVDGLMLSWSVGGYPSPNLQVAKLVLGDGMQREAALNTIARQRYGPAGEQAARAAWSKFSEAFRQYPYHIGVLYRGPQQMGPANLLYGESTGYRATMVGIPYDDVNGWRGPYPAEVLAGQFEKLAAGWADGVQQMGRVVEQTEGEHHAAAVSDWRIARAAGLHFESVANQVRFVLMRDALAKATDDAERERLRGELVKLLDREIVLARALYDVAKMDSRIGFEASNVYFYVPGDLVEKVVNCRSLRERYGR